MREKVAQRLTKQASSPKRISSEPAISREPPMSREAPPASSPPASSPPASSARAASGVGGERPVAESALHTARLSSEPPPEPSSEHLDGASDAALIGAVGGGVGEAIDDGVGRRPRALIVDDDPEVRRALARLLGPELEVHLAGSVGEAEAALSQLDRVDVAFVDLELPDGTGEEILEQLSAWPDAIRVLISGRIVSNENPLKNRALANLVLGKPVASHVVEALKRATLLLPRG